MREPVRLYGASPQGLRAGRTHKSFIQCAGARPPGLCTVCFCARAEACADELMCENLHFYGTSPQELCALCGRVCRWAHVRESVRLYGASPHKGFMQCTSELVYMSLRPRGLCAVCMIR